MLGTCLLTFCYDFNVYDFFWLRSGFVEFKERALKIIIPIRLPKIYEGVTIRLVGLSVACNSNKMPSIGARLPPHNWLDMNLFRDPKKRLAKMI